jgi:two-component system CheB/CheR fusion protein
MNGRALGALLFVVLSSLNLYLVYSLKSANNQRRDHEDQLELINRELKHRIKNLFTMATTVCQQTIRSGISLEAMSQAVAGRIHAIASGQELLSVTSDKGADLPELVDAVVKPVAPDPAKLKTSGPNATLDPHLTTPIALILHELATNALKYGAWSASGHVELQWRVEGQELHLTWRERDGPAVAPPVREGLGSTLIKRGLPNAKVAHDLHPEGLECRITVPVHDPGSLPTSQSSK